jgi:DnaK suppressor protein
MSKHLTPAQLEALRARLVARAATLRTELGVALHEPSARHALGLPNRREETDDDALADLESSLDIAAVDRDARELGDVNDALARLEAGGYGLCEDCGGAIPWPRLQAQPQARRCIACETELERRRPVVTPGL